MTNEIIAPETDQVKPLTDQVTEQKPDTGKAQVQASTPDWATHQLAEPIVQGDRRIEQITVLAPSSAVMRGSSLADLYGGEFDEMISILPRTTSPMLSEQDIEQLDAGDFAALVTILHLYMSRGATLSVLDQSLSNPERFTIPLERPILMPGTDGAPEQEITVITLCKPKVGQLRKIRMINVQSMRYETITAILRLSSNLSDNAEAALSKLTIGDIWAVSCALSHFFTPRQTATLIA